MQSTEPPRIEKRPRNKGGGGGGGGRGGGMVEKETNRPAQGTSHGERLKVVVRRLPPCLTEEEFREVVKPWINDDTIEWFTYVKGKVSEDRNKEKVAARAYAKFKTAEKLVALGRDFSGKPLTDSKGNQTIPSVEFSPFQRTPKKYRKPDSRQGTIEKDQDYIAFLESLKTPEGTEKSGESNLNNDKPEKPSSTPLIDYLRAQKSTSAAKTAATASPEKLSAEAAKAAKLKERARGRRGGKGKERERVPAAPAAPVIVPKLAKRESSNLQAQSDTTTPVNPIHPKRSRPTGAAAAAIVQRDLSLNLAAQARRRRGDKQADTDSTPATPTGPAGPSTPTTPSLPGTPTASEGGDSRRSNPRRNKDRFRGERNAPRRAETAPALDASTVVDAVNNGKQLPSLPSLAPMAILRKQNTAGASGAGAAGPSQAPQGLRRESTAPAASTGAPGPANANIPTGPKGGRADRGGRRGGRGGGGGGGPGPAATAAPAAVAATGDGPQQAPPTGPQGGGGGRGGRGGRGRGGFRGGRGRGGGGPLAARGG